MPEEKMKLTMTFSTMPAGSIFKSILAYINKYFQFQLNKPILHKEGQDHSLVQSRLISSKMDWIPIRVFAIFFFLFLWTVNSEEDAVKESMIKFMNGLSAGNAVRVQNMGWNMSSDPCTDKWVGVSCDLKQISVKKIVLDELNFTGVLDASSVCKTKSLAVLSIIGNKVVGDLPNEIGDCRQLTHMYLGRNQFSGSLPASLSRLSNLKRLDISNNGFSGELPDIGRISGLLSLFAENNDLSGRVPEFDFSNLEDFNVSYNNFSGPVPDVQGHFKADSFLGNPGLCGELVSETCPPSPPLPQKKSGGSKTQRVLIYSGYVLLGLIVVLFIAYKVISLMKGQNTKKGVAVDNKSSKSNKSSSPSSSDTKSSGKSDNSMSSAESLSPAPLVVLNGGPVVKGLRFEDLLRAPAELIGRGKYGSLYKVLLGEGVTLAVKRIKDWGISRMDFKNRMRRLDQVKHPNVLSALAFYCSKQEKLLAYEFQHNGSLFKLLHGSQNGQMLDWGSRLGIAASISESLAFMHNELRQDRIAHGNLKSTNILITKNMEPCISEYGLMVIENEQDQTLLDNMKENGQSGGQPYSTFKVDIYGFGMILLELLTGKLVQNNGSELAKWVHSVVTEEWTVEVFDKALFKEGASEERMVNLLQVAMKCINPSPNERPSINQVVAMISEIKEEEERSTVSDPW